MYDYNSNGNFGEDDGDLLDDERSITPDDGDDTNDVGGDIDSVIRINIPDNLRVANANADDEATPNFADDFAANFSISRTTGSTRLAIPRYTTVPPPDETTGIVDSTITAVMINVVRMNQGDRIEIDYTVDLVGGPNAPKRYRRCQQRIHSANQI